MPRPKGFSGIAQTFEEWTRGEALLPDLFPPYNQSAPECEALGACRDPARLELMAILFFVCAVTVVSGVLERLPFYRKWDLDRRLYCVNCCMHAIYAAAIAVVGLRYTLAHKEAGVLAGRDPESDQLLAFAQGFFMFQTSLLLLQLPFSRLVRRDVWGLLHVVGLAATSGSALITGHGSWGWLLVLSWEFTTPVVHGGWILSEAGYTGKPIAKVFWWLSVVAFSLRNCLSAWFWQSVFSQWDGVLVALGQPGGGVPLGLLLAVAAIGSVEGVLGLQAGAQRAG